ncbi:hypothetical protein D3C75_1109670 [compost metagenome]
MIFMSDFGWALVLSFVLVVGAARMFTRRTGRRLNAVQAILPVPVSFLLAAVFVLIGRIFD